MCRRQMPLLRIAVMLGIGYSVDLAKSFRVNPSSGGLGLGRRVRCQATNAEFEAPAPINGGEGSFIEENFNKTNAISAEEFIPMSSPFSLNEFLKMQAKQVVVTIRYSGSAGLKPYYLTAAQKIKTAHPDIHLEKRILPTLDFDTKDIEPTFEILVDGKVVIGKGNTRVQKLGSPNSGSGSGNKGVEDRFGLSIYVAMQEIDLAIAKARRRRRPNSVYGDVDGPPVRLEVPRKNEANACAPNKRNV